MFPHLHLRGKGGGGVRDAPLLCFVVAAAPPVPLILLLLPLLLLATPSIPSTQMCVLSVWGGQNYYFSISIFMPDFSTVQR